MDSGTLSDSLGTDKAKNKGRKPSPTILGAGVVSVMDCPQVSEKFAPKFIENIPKVVTNADFQIEIS